MTEHTTPFSLDEIGYSPVRFNNTGIFETHKDHMVDPYAQSRPNKIPQVEGIQFAPQGTKDILPAMVVLHDRYGLTSSIQDLAKQFACEGYVVLLPNLYGRQGGMVTANAEVAEALEERLDEKQVLQEINACFEYLNANLTEDKTLERTTRNAHAVIGFGMGGTLAIKTAAHRRRLQAAVSVCGSLPSTPETVSTLYCPLFIQSIETNSPHTAEELSAFCEQAKEAGKTIKTSLSSQATREFFNKSSEDYDEAETERVIQSSMEFINDILVKKP